MVRYRRARFPGATYFFTVTLRDRGSDILVAHIDAVRNTFRDVRRQWPYHIDAMVVLPDHIHVLWTLPEGDADYSGRWRAIKARFSRALVRDGVPLIRDQRGEYDLWQRRFWEHVVRNETDFARHVDYIHYNPVKHGLVDSPADWRFSSIHRYVREGIIPSDWGGADNDGDFGE